MQLRCKNPLLLGEFFDHVKMVQKNDPRVNAGVDLGVSPADFWCPLVGDPGFGTRAARAATTASTR